MDLAVVRNLAVIFALTVGGILGLVTMVDACSGDDEGGSVRLPDPDVPPLEYVYLDSARVLAYLGQVEQGLAMTEPAR